MSVSKCLDLDWEGLALDVVLPPYLKGSKSGYFSLKFQKPLITR